MRGFPRRGLHLAVAACFAAAGGAARAVYESPDGTGQALIYPYYTVQSAGGNAFNTYLSVVNSASTAKAVKVRFREGGNGREALGFNLFLAPNDVWTAALGPADASEGAPARIVTADRSCTMPPLPSGGMAFNNFNYSGVMGDGGATTLDRTREGYFEIIEMATLGGIAATSVTQNGAGVPANCAAVQGSAASMAALQPPNLSAPTGGLSGTYVLISVANGLSFSGNATALAQFSSTALYTDVGSDQPNLASANPPFATTVAQSNLSTSKSGPSLLMYGATYANGRDAVSATLMKSSLVNEFVLDSATRSATDWVVTFPTKAFYVAPGSGAATAPFSNNFGSAGSCEPMAFAYFNREEAGVPVPADQFGVLPPPKPSPMPCWSANVITIGGTDAFAAVSTLFGSRNAIIRGVNGQPNGWAVASFTGSLAATAGLTSASPGQALNLSSGAVVQTFPINHRGLPVIGFAARTLNNGLLDCTTFGGSAGRCAGSYGALLDHRAHRTTTPLP